jgi:stage III sporulation protein AG
MEAAERIKNFLRGRKHSALIAVCGISGLMLLMMSSVVSGKKGGKTEYKVMNSSFCEAETYCRETEKRLGNFLSDIEGAGEVRVFLTVAGDQRNVYAKEKRRSLSENKNEEEEKYVMIGSGSEKNALIETVKAPEIVGAVILCSGGKLPSVSEQIYKAVAAALDLPTSKIFVSKLG